MNTKWKSIWEKRTADMEVLQSGDLKSIVLELKRCNGFDVVSDGLTFETILQQYNNIKNNLSLTDASASMPLKSVYEVGGGSGANLYLFEKDGIQCGMMDYSKNLVEIAQSILKTQDIICDEAIHLKESPQYDAVLANSVFSYFSDEIYAQKVLEKMYLKSRRAIGIIDVHDKEKEEAFINYRKTIVENYEEKYKDLPKLFYSKAFFESFAATHNLKIKFIDSDMDGYWNNDFVFNCYLYKNK